MKTTLITGGLGFIGSNICDSLLQKKYTIVLVLLLISILTFSQKTKVSGVVKDSVTNEPLPFVNVFFDGTKVGVTTDFEGKFTIETFYATDSLVISFIFLSFTFSL